MLQVFLITGFIIQGVHVFSQTLLPHYSYTFSDYYDESTKTWRPSKCDCDYESGDLYLKPDSIFYLELQEGRLDPEKERIYGKWHIENDTILLLECLEQEMQISPENEVVLRFGRIPYTGNYPSRSFYIRNPRIYDGNRFWK